MASALAFWRWPRRRWFRILWCLLAVALLAALPMIIIEFKKSNFSVKYQAWFISGMFVLMALPVSIYEVAMHLEYFSRPKLQIRVIRILWMVPVYAVDSWFALRFKVRRLGCACPNMSHVVSALGSIAKGTALHAELANILL